MARAKKSAKITKAIKKTIPATPLNPNPPSDPVLDAYERETIINMNESDATATVYTYKKKYKEQLVALAFKHPDQFKILHPVLPTDEDYLAVVEDSQRSMTFEFPWKFVAFHAPRERMELTEEQKDALRERIAKAREVKAAMKK